MGVEPLMTKLQNKIRRVNTEILDAVRAQSTSGSQAKADLQAGQQAIAELNGHIQEIRSKAEQSEAMVQEICRDIKKLDYAKKHLTSTITALRRLGMLGARAWSRGGGASTATPPLSLSLLLLALFLLPLASPLHHPSSLLSPVSAVEQLEDEAGRKRYRNAANLLEAVNQLSAHFEAYKEIPRVGEVRAKVGSIKSALRAAVFDDFARFGREGDEALYAGGELADACLVVDALEPHVREDLVGALCGRELDAYGGIFSPSAGEASHLDKVDRRYAYIKKKARGKTIRGVGG